MTGVFVDGKCDAIYGIHTDPMGMGVSVNGGTPKWMAYNGKYHSKRMI